MTRLSWPLASLLALVLVAPGCQDAADDDADTDKVTTTKDGDPNMSSGMGGMDSVGGSGSGGETKTDGPSMDSGKKPDVPAVPSVPAVPANLDAAAVLKNPALATLTAPDTFKVNFETTVGNIVLEIYRAWSPRGADRFYNLVQCGFYDKIAFFRVIDGFMAQFGISGDPEVSKLWRVAKIADDRVVKSNKTGYITYATSGSNSRTTQMFINLGDNAGLDNQGFSPMGKVIEGMDVVKKIFVTREGAPSGPGPAQGRVQSEGAAYLSVNFPQLDYILSASIVN